jgi:hypothetical protein
MEYVLETMLKSKELLCHERLARLMEATVRPRLRNERLQWEAEEETDLAILGTPSRGNRDGEQEKMKMGQRP